MDQIRRSIQDAREYLGANPGDGRYTDSAAVADLGDGLHVTVTGPYGEILLTDMPHGVGGDASAPSPGWVLRAALASCAATLIAMRAAEVGIQLDRVRVTVTSESDDRGILGLDDATPAGPLSTSVAVHIQAPGVTAARLQDIVRWGVDHCPVVDAIRRPVPLEVNVTGFAGSAASE